MYIIFIYRQFYTYLKPDIKITCRIYITLQNYLILFTLIYVIPNWLDFITKRWRTEEEFNRLLSLTKRFIIFNSVFVFIFRNLTTYLNLLRENFVVSVLLEKVINIGVDSFVKIFNKLSYSSGYRINWDLHPSSLFSSETTTKKKV